MTTVNDTEYDFPTIWLGEIEIANGWFIQFKLLAALEDGRWLFSKDLAVKKFKRSELQFFSTARNHIKGRGLWSFEVRRKVGGSLAFEVFEPKRALPLVDLREKSLDSAQHLLLKTGVRLPDHGSRQAVVMLAGNLYTLLRFESVDDQKKYWKARIPDGVVELRRADPQWMNSGEFAGWRYFPSSTEPAGEIVEKADWQPDGEFLDKVLRRYMATVDAWTGLTAAGSGASIRAVERILSDALTLADSAEEIQGLARRLKGSWPKLLNSQEAVKEIGQLLLESPEGKKIREDAVTAHVRQVAADIELCERQKIESELKNARSEVQRCILEVQEATAEVEKTDRLFIERKAILDRIVSEVTAEEDRLQKLKRDVSDCELMLHEAAEELARVEKLREQLNSSVADASAEFESITAVVDEFAKKVETEFSISGVSPDPRLTAFAARLQTLFDRSGRHVVASLPAPTPPWWSMDRPGEVPLITVGALKQRLTEEAKAYGIQADDIILMDTLIRSGELVVVTGTDAELAIEAYARSVAGGCVRNHTLDPSTIGVDDLWRSPSTQSPTAFAHAWHIASTRPDQIVLLCLRSIDASPAGLWMPPLATFLADDRRPSNLLIVATAPRCAHVLETSEAIRKDLRHHAVGFRPRMRLDASTCKAALGAALPAATKLKLEPLLRSVPDFEAVIDIGDKAVHPAIARRVVRFLRAANDSLGGQKTVEFAIAWAHTLKTGETNGLPASIADGYADIFNLESRA